MAVVGSGAHLTAGTYVGVPDYHQNTLAMGINLIELRLPYPKDNTQIIIGPVDVAVKADFDGRRTRYQDKWNLENPCIPFKVVNADGFAGAAPTSQKGLCVAFMPDDKHWRNRLYLVDSRSLYDTVFQFHSRDGIITGAEFKVEIDAFRSVISEAVTVFYVLDNNGRYVEKYDDRTIADNLIKEKNDALKTSTIVGKWRVQEGKERRRAPQILEIIQRNAGLEWGWTSSEDFVRDIKPKIVALIKERKAALQPQQGHLTRDELISAIRDLGVEERKELLQAKGVPTLNSEPEPGLRSYKKGYLNTLSVQVLSDECHNLGIEINSETTKKQMIDLIVEFKAKLPEETALPTEVTEA